MAFCEILIFWRPKFWPQILTSKKKMSIILDFLKKKIKILLDIVIAEKKFGEGVLPCF